MAELVSPGPSTATEVAEVLAHVSVVEPGATLAVGEALIVALTEPTAATVIAVERVTGPPLPCAVRV